MGTKGFVFGPSCDEGRSCSPVPLPRLGGGMEPWVLGSCPGLAPCSGVAPSCLCPGSSSSSFPRLPPSLVVYLFPLYFCVCIQRKQRVSGVGALPGPCARVGVLCPQCVSWADRPRGKERTLPCSALQRGEALSCCGVLHRDPQLCSAGPRGDRPPLATVLTARNAERHCKAEIVRRKSLQLPAQYILKQDNPSRGTRRP